MPPVTEQKTRQVRVSEDLADMASEIIDVEGGSVADLLDPILRPALAERHKRIRSRAEMIKAARAGNITPRGAKAKAGA